MQVPSRTPEYAPRQAEVYCSTCTNKIWQQESINTQVFSVKLEVSEAGAERFQGWPARQPMSAYIKWLSTALPAVILSGSCHNVGMGGPVAFGSFERSDSQAQVSFGWQFWPRVPSILQPSAIPSTRFIESCHHASRPWPPSRRSHSAR
jgi:hypothetical protein